MEFAFTAAVIGAMAGYGCALAVACFGRRTIPCITFVVGMSLAATESALSGLSCRFVDRNLLSLQRAELCLDSVAVATWLLFSLSYARGNSREFLCRWRLAVVGAFVLPCALIALWWNALLSSTVRHGAGQWAIELKRPAILLVILLLFGTIFVLANLERTFRTAVGAMRWRIKFMFIGLGVFFAVRIYTHSEMLLFRSTNSSLALLDSLALIIACALLSRSLLRSGHFDVDVYPSTEVLHHSVTVFVSGIYLLTVGVLAKIVAALGGGGAFSLQAFLVLVMLVLLSVALLSDKVQLQTRRFVSRHFRRPIHDYGKVWQRFTDEVASGATESSLCRSAIDSTADLFQALSVSIWTVDDQQRRLVCAASSFLPQKVEEPTVIDSVETAVIIESMRANGIPQIIESDVPWIVPLKRCHPNQFQEGGARICVPLVASGEPVGLMILGDRVSGVGWSPQDLDLLKCIGHQLGVSLFNIHAAQQLSQAKQLEAFQTMSAFFVHDLKNTASTLNLMLQNLPAHFENPVFRQDALRGIGQTVAHINHLISRLSLLRSNLELHLADCDLNELIEQFMREWEQTAKVDVVKDLRPMPRLRVDPEQILKVVTNLVLNARDALVSGGQIRIVTELQAQWAVLSVSDTGCGMSPEFLHRSLFRPFQTTKRSGIGIGLFQSRMIVQAHHGRIEAASEPGKGSTFHVYLPVQNQNHEPCTIDH